MTMGRRLLIGLVIAALVAIPVAFLFLSDAPGTPSSQSAITTTSAAFTTTSEPTTEQPGVGPLILTAEEGRVIEGIRIANPDGNCVEIAHSSDVVIRDSMIGPCGGHAVTIDNSSAVQVEGVTITGSASGIYAHDSEAISVVGNVFRDAGRNFIQFDQVRGSGNAIVENRGRNRLGESNAEDFVSIYKSGGTPESPLRVVGNEFSGGGPSTSGSGIMVGDRGGSHIVVEGNVLENPGQVGIGVAGGSDIRVVNNVVSSAPHEWSNVGIYVWNQSDDPCEDIEVRANRVDWAGSGGSPNPSWDSGDCGQIAGWDDNDWGANLG